MQFVYPHARTHARTRGTGTRRGRATGQCRGAVGFAWQIERAQSMATLLGVRVERGGKGQVGRCPIIQRGLFGARTSALGGHHRLFSRVTLLLDGLGRGGGSRRRLSADASAPLRCGSLWFASVSSRRTIKYNFLGRGAWCLPATSSGVPRTDVFVAPGSESVSMFLDHFTNVGGRRVERLFRCRLPVGGRLIAGKCLALAMKIPSDRKSVV